MSRAVGLLVLLTAPVAGLSTGAACGALRIRGGVTEGRRAGTVAGAARMPGLGGAPSDAATARAEAALAFIDASPTPYHCANTAAAALAAGGFEVRSARVVQFVSTPVSSDRASNRSEARGLVSIEGDAGGAVE